MTRCSPAASPRRNGQAWLLLAAALAVHVVDETATEFLAFYNPMAEAIRRKIPFLPLPVFEFRWWLAGLILGIILLFAVSPFVFRGARWSVPVSRVLGVLMLFNALLHGAASVYLGRPAPGLYSSPLLAAASIALLLSTRSSARRPRPTEALRHE